MATGMFKGGKHGTKGRRDPVHVVPSRWNWALWMSRRKLRIWAQWSWEETQPPTFARRLRKPGAQQRPLLFSHFTPPSHSLSCGHTGCWRDRINGAHRGCCFISSTHSGGRVRTGVVCLHYHVTYSLNIQHWKKSYDKPRQRIKKQRHHFTNKDPSSQSHGFSSSHGLMWELDQKEGWVLKNWCFWTVVLEKTLESSLDSKEIKPVNPKGNQPWIFFGRTNAEAPILWSPDAKSQLTGKKPWCWQRLRARGKGGHRGWDGRMGLRPYHPNAPDLVWYRELCRVRPR